MPAIFRPQLVALAVLLVMSATTVHAQRDLRDIPNPDPEIERRTFVLPEGFEANLYAADPLIAKPIQMNFDAAGRLWIASSSVYPQIKPGQQADDKILVVEDTTGDGRGDRVTVFADGLLIPTGVAPGDGGAYVANSTELVHLADVDGDGKADRRRVVLSGFGTEDTHHILHTFRWGVDGMLYMNQSIYIHSHIETPSGVRRLDAGGIWHFRPQTMQLEVFCRGFVNTWGHHQDRWGQSFATDGAYGEGINYVFPGAVFVTAKDAPRVLKGLNPGSPKHCGLEIASGRHLPEDWQGNMITNDFRAHRVCRFVVSDAEGSSGYVSREQQPVVRSNHVAFRPVDVKMGPDGAIYIADWYNPIIQHGEVDFRDPRRDQTRGRIWRITYPARPLVKPPKLVGAPVEELLAALKLPEDWTRLHAKLQMKERGAQEVLPALERWVAALDASHPEVEHHRLEALWVYQNLDVVEPRLLAQLLHSPEPRVRAAATRTVYHWHDRLPQALGLLEVMIADEHPRVRLEAVRALSQIRSPRAAELAARALDYAMDPDLDFAVWQTMRDLQSAWLPALQAGQIDFGGNTKHLTFALQAVGSPQVVEPLVALLAAGKLPPEREEGVLVLIAALGGPQQLQKVFGLALSEATGAARRAVLIEALAKTARQRSVRPAGDLSPVVALLGSDDERLARAAAGAVGAWKIEPARAKLLELAESGAAPAALRREAMDALALLGGEPSRQALLRLAADRDRAVQRMAVAALATLDIRQAAARGVEVLAATGDGTDPSELFAALLARSAGAAELTAALRGKALPADVAKYALRVVDASGRAEPELVEALRAAGGIAFGPRQLAPQEMERLVAEVAERGDAARGEAIFRRTQQACLKCHAIAGAGGRVGPDLVSLGASAPLDYIIESLLDPAAKVKENYHSVVVATVDGQILTGIKLRETGSELVLRDSEDREFAVPTDSIDQVADGGSLMPAGVVEELTRAELVNLARFLSELGKPGQYAVGRAAVVRRWEAVVSPRVAAQLPPLKAGDGEALDEPMGRSSVLWQPVYSTVGGELPLADLPRIAISGREGAVARLRFQVEVSAAGAIGIAINSASGLSVAHEDAVLPATGPVVLDLPRGLHTVYVHVDLVARSEPLRIDVVDLPGSAGRALPVGGK